MREQKPQSFMLTVIGWSLAVLSCLLALFGSLLLKDAPPDRTAVAALVAANADDFSKVIPGRDIQFPKDYGSHDDFRQEWWYVTGNLQDEAGNQYGVQWTLFRSAISSENGQGWNNNQIFMAHAVLTSKDGVYASERFSRGGIGQAGVTDNPFNVWLDNWQWRGTNKKPFPAKLQASDKDFSFTLSMSQTLPEILQGENGYSRKHAEKDVASYYFSVPAVSLDGTLELDGKIVKVSGKGWVDREWSTQALSEDQLGWDWFSIQLDDGRSLMLVQVRGEETPHRFGSITDAAGHSIILSNSDIDMTPIAFAKMPTGRHLPIKWQIKLPLHDIMLTTKPVHDQNWLPFTFPYWEGPILVRGTATGVGFMEATGY
ncbi:lipocalin-like domain-containing protein [Grimontia marina]|uniref:Hydroxyneurosporene synthase (CrtC) n=1 Tax=Grimontia marina TaxID=646534 RepID=A0A128FI35_9GAMM|nr:lipocalin-like domain-containing protein [Grimontia marina]CZF85926.1 Hydroxyneurosporene synthase (CrtC) [Grimontia marina]